MNQGGAYATSTDFCLVGYKKRRRMQIPMQTQRAYPYSQYTNQDEFFLAENLASSPKQRLNSSRSRMQIPKTSLQTQQRQVQSQISKQITGTTMMIQVSVMNQREHDATMFHESKLKNFKESSASTFDIFRPKFDSSGFFPFSVKLKSTKKACVQFSILAFKTQFLPMRLETIDSISIYLGLINTEGKRQELTSNVAEILLKPTKENKWSPLVFDEFDVYVDPTKETRMKVEIVANARVPSAKHPYELKYSKIAETVVKVVEIVRGEMRTIADTTYKFTVAFSDPGAETVIGYLKARTEHKEIKYTGLPVNFICPTDAAGAYAKIQKILKREYDPYNGNFALTNPALEDVQMFRDITFSHRTLQKVIERWDKKSEESLRQQIRAYHLCTKIVPQAARKSSVLLSTADSTDKAITGVSASLVNRQTTGGERFKPFNTSELRCNLVLWPIPTSK